MGDVYCGECGRDRSDDQTLATGHRVACPDCGETSFHYRRDLCESVPVSTECVTTALTPGVQDRDWKLRWKHLEPRLARVTGVRTEQRSADAVHGALEDLLVFFGRAYHLKDALIADGAVPGPIVEAAVTGSATLALLADLANLDKHRRLTRPPRSGHVPVIKRVGDTSSGGGWRLVVEIAHSRRVVDGVGFASTVVDEWRTHLRAWNLVV